MQSVIEPISEAIFSWRFVFTAEEHRMPDSSRKALQEQVNSLAKKMGIQKPLYIFETGVLCLAQAMGGASIPGRAGIAIDTDFLKTAGTGQEAILAHEIAHIAHNDRFSGLVCQLGVYTISAIATAILLPGIVSAGLIGGLASALIGTAVSAIALIIFSRWQEKRADIEGFDACSPEGKMGAITFFRTMQQKQLKFRNESNLSVVAQLWRKFLITAEGNCRLDILHPSLTTRIDYLYQRGMESGVCWV